MSIIRESESDLPSNVCLLLDSLTVIIESDLPSHVCLLLDSLSPAGQLH